MTKILESLQKINDELSIIRKDQEGFGYMFRGIDQVLNTMSPLFKKHKIIVSREVANVARGHRIDDKGRHVNQVSITFRYKFTSTEDGSTFVSEGIGEGEDRGDKATGCAISNSYKYVIFEMFNIATDEQKDSDMKYAEENKEKVPKKKTVVEDDGFGGETVVKTKESDPKKECEADDKEPETQETEKNPKRRFKRPSKEKSAEEFGG